MANKVQRAANIISALSDRTVPPPQIRDTLEEFLNKVGDNAGDDALAEEFLRIMSRILVNTVKGNAENRKRVEVAAEVSEAGNSAADKLPELPDHVGGRR